MSARWGADSWLMSCLVFVLELCCFDGAKVVRRFFTDKFFLQYRRMSYFCPIIISFAVNHSANNQIHRMTKIDHTDIEILRVLQRNGKLTVKELADRVHLSPSPTFERQRRLEREGYIERYVAKVNPKKVGNTIVVFCNIKLKQHSGRLSEEFMEAVRGIDEITECYNTSGDFDFMIKIFVRDMEHYQDFVLHKLGRIDSIGSLHSVFVIGEVKAHSEVPIAVDPLR